MTWVVSAKWWHLLVSSGESGPWRMLPRHWGPSSMTGGSGLTGGTLDFLGCCSPGRSHCVGVSNAFWCWKLNNRHIPTKHVEIRWWLQITYTKWKAIKNCSSQKKINHPTLISILLDLFKSDRNLIGSLTISSVLRAERINRRPLLFFLLGVANLVVVLPDFPNLYSSTVLEIKLQYYNIGQKILDGYLTLWTSNYFLHNSCRRQINF